MFKHIKPKRKIFQAKYLLFGFLLVATLTYLLLVDVAKRQLVRRARL